MNTTPSATDIILFFFLTFVAEIIGTIGGFGSSLFFVSMSQFFYDFETVLALTGMLHIFSNTAKIILFRKSIDWKLVRWLGITSILFAIGGAFLTTIVAFTYAKLLLGIFLISLSTLFIIRPETTVSPTLKNSLVGGTIAGFLAGFLGTGGAIRGLTLTAFNLEKNFFVGTSAMIDFGVDLSRTIIYLDNNYFTMEMWWYVPCLMTAAFAGSYIGKILLNKLSQPTFQKIVLGIVFFMGTTLLFEGIKKLL